MSSAGLFRRIQKRTIATAVGAALFGGSIVAFTPQVSVLLDRPACVETVMKAVSTDRPVDGTYSCFDPQYQGRLSRIDITSDQTFATKVGHAGQYHFLGKTPDGGYAYEYDEPLFPHNGWPIVRTSLGVAWQGVRRGDLTSARIPFEVAWNEATGKTQLWSSALLVIYTDPDGKIARIG